MENAKPTTAIQKAQKSELAQLLEARQASLAQVLPKHITPERMVKVALLCCNQTPALKKCTPESVFLAVLQSAETGLELGSALGHAYLIPYGTEAKFMPGYKGLVDLVRRSGTVKDIQVEIVFAKDEFIREGGFEPKFKHVPAEGDRGAPRGAYCIFTFKDGGHQATYMTTAEINAIRDVVLSKQRGDSPWKNHWSEMAKKTVVRRACKLAPVSREVADAIAAADEGDKHGYHEGGSLNALDFTIPDAPEKPQKQAEPHNPETGEVIDTNVVIDAKTEGGSRLKMTDQPEDEIMGRTPQVSAALKKALASIEQAKKDHDSKRLADTAVYIKESLKGDEHTQALAAYKAAKPEVEAREPGAEG